MTVVEPAVTTRVVVVDDHPVVREGVMGVLAGDPDLEVVGQASSGEEALEEVARSRPDVVVLDVRLPGISGIEAGRELLARHPELRIVVLTSFPSDAVLRAALAMGAQGLLVKESNRAVMREAVRTVAQGESFVDPRVAARVAALTSSGRRGAGPQSLTSSEVRVMELLPRGLSNKEIAGLLGVSANTVKSHLANAMRKLQVHSRAEATAVVVREGLG